MPIQHLKMNLNPTFSSFRNQLHPFILQSILLFDYLKSGAMIIKTIKPRIFQILLILISKKLNSALVLLYTPSIKELQLTYVYKPSKAPSAGGRQKHDPG
jgi:hypothetical protein